MKKYLTLAFALITLTASAQPPIVKTHEGYVKGLDEKGIAVFKGIPYAQPPMGDLRYRPPITHTPWTDTVNTTQFGPSSLQPSGTGVAGSENCLYLNLYTPKIDDQKRAVLVWVHGGSMTAGSGRGMNGHAFADKDDIVTITINYRLGALAFLPMGDVDKRYRLSGNLGLLDVIAALQWIHENIAAFGGDPARVTVMGESAGAKLLSAVMVSPAAKDLFQQAILESGSVQCIRDTVTAKNERNLLLQQLGLAPNEAGKLLTMPADSIIKAQGKICNGIGGNSFFGPVLDGITIPVDAYKYVEQHNLSNVKAIIGTNENEGASFIDKNEFEKASILGKDKVPGRGNTDGNTGANPGANIDVNTSVFQPLFRSNAPMAEAYYQTRLKTDSPYAAMVRTLTQYMYQMHSYRFAKALTDAGISVWMYRYKYQNGREFGARHGDELHYIWDADKIETGNETAAKKQLAKTLHSAWVTFIKTGDPNPQGTALTNTSNPNWPTYNNKKIIIFDSTGKVTQLKEVYNDKTFPSAVFILH